MDGKFVNENLNEAYLNKEPVNAIQRKNSIDAMNGVPMEDQIANPVLQHGVNPVQEKLNLRDFVIVEAGEQSVRDKLRFKLELNPEIDTRKDSAYMQAVKNALGELTQLTDEKLLDQKKEKISIEGDQQILHQKLDDIEEKYIAAIGKCQIYLKERASKINVSSTRVNMVRRTMQQLQREANCISELRKDMIESPESYEGHSNVTFLEMIYHMRTRKATEDAINKIELKEYVRLLTNRDDLIFCKNGKLLTRKAEKEERIETTKSRENYWMAERLVRLMLSHQNATTPEQTERIRKNLLLGIGADPVGKVCGPVRMASIMDLLLQFSSYSSDVDRVLCEKKDAAKLNAEEQPLEYRTASRIHELLGNNYTRKGKETNQDLEDRLKRQILDIMENCQKKKGWTISALREEELDYLVKGRLQAVRDEVYHRMMHIYEGTKRLHENPVKEISDDDLNLLLGLTISEMVADKDSIKESMIIQLNRLEESNILSADQNLRNAINKLNINAFERVNTKALRDYVQIYDDRWKKVPQENREAGLVAITKIINNMQEIRMLEHKGLHQGLTAEETSRLKTRVAEISSNYSEQRQNIQLIKQGFDTRTAICRGIAELEKRFRKNGGLWENDFDVHIQKLRKQDPEKREAHQAEKIPGEANQEEFRQEQQNQQNLKLEQVKEQLLAEDPQEKKTVELVTESEALKFATKLLPAKEADFITSVFLKGNPAGLIQRNGDDCSKEIMRLHDAILSLSQKQEPLKKESIRMSVAGNKFTLKQDASGMLSIKIGAKEMVLPCNAEYWVEMIENDICSNFGKYEQSEAKKLMSAAADRDKSKASPVNGEERLIYERFLTYHLGIPAEDTTNLRASYLRDLVRAYCQDVLTKDNILDAVKTANASLLNKTYINSTAAIESLNVLENRLKSQKKPQVEKKKNQLKIKNDESSWTETEQTFLNLMGELYFQRGVTEQLDNEKPYDAKRLQTILKNRIEDLVTVLNMGSQGREKVLKTFASFPPFQEAFKVVNALMEGFQQNFLGEADLNKVKAALDAPGVLGVLDGISTNMQDAVNSSADAVQQMLRDAANEITDDSADDKWKEMSDYTLNELIAKGMTGKEGEGAFNKKVLSSYVGEASFADKQKMLAFAFRSAPKLDEKFMEQDDAEEQVIGKFLAGYVKGAGPLLHKMLQGLPVSSMPPALQTMVSDVRSNLMEIDEDLVDAQLQSIIDESKGNITKIEKLDVLGAASVGQTILVRVHERGKAQSTEKVIKILRPDVQNQMKREINFMEKCAKEVDQEAANAAANQQPAAANVAANQQPEAANAQANNQAAQQPEGGMLKTFQGKENVIRKELDLRLEADNVIQGQIYEDEMLHIKSMKIDKNAKSSIRALVLEKAEGKSVDKFIKDVNTQRENTETSKDSIYRSVKDLSELRKDLQNKQQYLNNLLSKWVEEAIFGSGFFHGDLHAGNVMMDENGVTVIDFGNASKLSDREQKHILNMLAAVEKYNTDRSLDHIRALLSDESKLIYDGKERDFKENLRTIIKMEDGTGVQKILVILNELQRGGMAIPSGLYNFIQCFERIMGTITDYKTLISNVDESISKVLKREKEGNIFENPENGILPVVLEKLTLDKKKKTDAEIRQVVEKAMVSKEVDMGMIDEYGKLMPDLLEADNILKKASNRMPAVFQPIDKAKVIHQLLFSDRQNVDLFRKLQYGMKIEKKDAITLVGRFDAIQTELWTKQFLLIDTNLEIAKTKKEKLQIKKKEEPDNQDIDREIEKCDQKIEFYQQSGNTINAKMEEIRNSVASIKEKLNPPAEKQEAAKSQEQKAQEEQECLEKAENTFKDFMAVLKQLSLCAGENEKERNLLDGFWNFQLSAPIKGNVPIDVKNSMQQDHEAERKKIEENAKAINSQAVITTYRDKMVQTLLNADECTKLGNSLKEWFEDNTIGGEQLKKAYDDLNRVRETKEMTKDTKEVSDFVNAFTNCVVRRTSGILSMADQNKNERQNDEGDVLVAMIQSNLDIAKDMLDLKGVPYLFDHRLSEAEKLNLKRGKRERKTRHVNDLYEDMSMGDLELLNCPDSLRSFSEKYQSLAEIGNWRIETAKEDAKKKLDKYNKLERKMQNNFLNDEERKELEQQTEQAKEESRQAEEEWKAKKSRGGLTFDEKNQKTNAENKLNENIQKVMHRISKLRLGEVERRRVDNLFRRYENRPSEDALAAIMMEVGKFIDKEFQDTDYTDPAKHDPIALSGIFDKTLTTREILPKKGLLKLSNQARKDADGKRISLMDRLKNGEAINWLTRA